MEDAYVLSWSCLQEYEKVQKAPWWKFWESDLVTKGSSTVAYSTRLSKSQADLILRWDQDKNGPGYQLLIKLLSVTSKGPIQNIGLHQVAARTEYYTQVSEWIPSPVQANEHKVF